MGSIMGTKLWVEKNHWDADSDRVGPIGPADWGIKSERTTHNERVVFDQTVRSVKLIGPPDGWDQNGRSDRQI